VSVSLGPEVVQLVGSLAQPLEFYGPTRKADFSNITLDEIDWNFLYNGLVQTQSEAIIYVSTFLM
jgi:hypothetical protein